MTEPSFAASDVANGDAHTALGQQVEVTLSSLMTNRLLKQHRIDAVDIKIVVLRTDRRGEMRSRALEAAVEIEGEVLS